MNGRTMNKSFVFLTGGFFLLVLLSIIHLTQGQADYSISELLDQVWIDGRIQDIVVSLRLPRLFIGILAGGAKHCSSISCRYDWIYRTCCTTYCTEIGWLQAFASYPCLWFAWWITISYSRFCWKDINRP
jgi:hypothetical protein